MLTGPIVEAPTSPTYTKIKSPELAVILRRINQTQDRLGLSEASEAQKRATIIYLGLCVLKQYKDGTEKDVFEAEQSCQKWLSVLSPGSDGERINVSRFSGDQNTFIDHKPIIQNAGRFFLPNVRAFHKQSAVLLAIGSEYDPDKHTLPADDSWIQEYSFL